jgi:hypothetical protein
MRRRHPCSLCLLERIVYPAWFMFVGFLLQGRGNADLTLLNPKLPPLLRGKKEKQVSVGIMSTCLSSEGRTMPCFTIVARLPYVYL